MSYKELIKDIEIEDLKKKNEELKIELHDIKIKYSGISMIAKEKKELNREIINLKSEINCLRDQLYESSIKVIKK